MRKGWIVLGLAALLLGFALLSGAFAADRLLVCGVCDKAFYETAVKLVQEMGLADKVSVKKSSCLGACAAPPVIEFKGELYTSMTAEKLRALLKKAYP